RAPRLSPPARPGGADPAQRAIALPRGHAHRRERSKERRRAGKDHLDIVAGEPDEPARLPVEGLEHQHLLDPADHPPSELTALRPADLPEDATAAGDRAGGG